MYVKHKVSGEEREVEVVVVASSQFSTIKKLKQFVFAWEKCKEYDVYQLRLKESHEMLGLMAVEDFPGQGYDYLEIKLLEVQKQSRGEAKGWARIGGCLLGYAAQLSVAYGHDGWLFLVAKNERADVFRTKFGFRDLLAVQRVAVPLESTTANSEKLINEYVKKTS